MRKVVAIACGALIAFSAPAFAQSAGGQSPSVAQPSGSSVVNYQNGLEALGQAAPGQGQGQDRRDEGGNNGLEVALGVAAVAGGVGLGIALYNANKNKSVSP